MRIQNIVFPKETDEKKELFFRGNLKGVSDENTVSFENGTDVLLNTYMNIFDAGTWNRYTGIKNWQLILKAAGTGKVLLYRFCDGKNEIAAYEEFHATGFIEKRISFMEEKEAFYWLKVEPQKDFLLAETYFSAECDKKREICIGTVICTYRREKQLLENLDKLKKSFFFRVGTEYYGKLKICIVDNAAELQQCKDKFTIICHNSNTGGSGGFSKGMDYMRQYENGWGITNVVLMDDDVEFYMETFYRMYALLALAKTEILNRVIAGRMFRTDQRYIQYTKTEIWNRSEILHTGWMQDMRFFDNLLFMNREEGEYSGWWFACFPMTFVKKEKPIPFFLHCDDVEYGLRLGEIPLTLNGIQVWHETYEYRKSSVITYYDVRNSLIVNAVRGCSVGRRDLWKLWQERLGQYIEHGEMAHYHAAVLGLLDFTKGARFFFDLDLEKHHEKLKQRIERLGEKRTAFYLRIIYCRLMIFYKKIQNDYRRFAKKYCSL